MKKNLNWSKKFFKNKTFHHTVFEKIFLKVLGRHAPIKNKTIRPNHAPYVPKTMRKAIMKRTELQDRYFKIR